MENFCKGLVFGAVVGMCVGGIIVAKNKKLANKIKDGVCTASEKLEEAKDAIIEKFEEKSRKEKKSNCEYCDEKSNDESESSKKDQDKKFKN